LRCERGQATVEWTAIVLVVALALAALLEVTGDVDGRDLGAAVAGRIVCAAGGACQEAEAAVPIAAPVRRAEPARTAAPARTAVPARIAAPVPIPRMRLPRGSPGAPARARPRVGAVAKALARRAWIACLGWKRFAYERAHPERLDPLQAIPVRDGLRIANACLNPAGFLEEP
jgi:hypothetical protein